MKSELQNAADRVRETQEAIEVRQAELAMCERQLAQAKEDVVRAQLAEREARRHMNNCYDILKTQEVKLQRDLEEVRNLAYSVSDYASPSETVQLDTRIQQTHPTNSWRI